MTTTTDSKQYTESQYKRMYYSVLNERDHLRLKIVSLETKIRSLENKRKPKHIVDLPIDIQILKNIVESRLSLSLDLKCRRSEIVIGRAMYYKVLRMFTLLSLNEMASTLALLHDHATVINSLNKHDDWYEFDKLYKRKFDEIINEIKNEKEKVQNLQQTI
jgi:chromosomal replication initiation ATPase DnaA